MYLGGGVHKIEEIYLKTQLGTGQEKQEEREGHGSIGQQL